METLVAFMLNSKEIWSVYSPIVPRVGDFVRLVRRGVSMTYYRVDAVLWEFSQGYGGRSGANTIFVHLSENIEDMPEVVLEDEEI